MFKKATKERARARVALTAPSGAGKTYTALLWAQVFADDGRIAVIDTERGSASKYASDFDFDVVELESYSPRLYCEAIDAAASAGYPVLVIDSLSHAWTGEGGILDQVDKRGGKFSAWKDVTPMQQALVDAILSYPGHVIATMRAKTEWAVDTDERTGKKTVAKLGLAPSQKAGIEYEFDVVGTLDQKHTLTIDKSRCLALADQVIRTPGAEVAQRILDWLNDGGEPLVERVLRLVAEGSKDEARGLYPRLSKGDQRRVKEALADAAQRERDETQVEAEAGVTASQESGNGAANPEAPFNGGAALAAAMVRPSEQH